MSKSNLERQKEYRERRKLRGFKRVGVYLDEETRKRFESFAQKAGGYDVAIKKLLDHVNLPS